MGLLSGKNKNRRDSSDSKLSTPKALGRLFANLAPNAKYRKGDKDEERDQIEAEIEYHLCQLAMMENYASHKMYVKFTEDEVEELEENVMNFAIKESLAEEESLRTGIKQNPNPKRLSLGNTAFSLQEAQQILQSLKAEDDPLFSQINPSVAKNYTVNSMNTPPVMQNRDYKDMNGDQVSPPPKRKPFSALRKKLGLKKLSKKEPKDEPKAERSMRGSRISEERLSGQDKKIYRIGSYDHFAAEADELGMEYANGYIFPRDAQGNEGDNTIPESPQIENLEERQNLEIAMEASQIQIGYDNILRKTKLLQRDLDYEMDRCKKKMSMEETRRGRLDRKMQDLLSVQRKVPVRLTSELAQAQHSTSDAQTRVEVLTDAVAELANLVEYIETKRPPLEDAEKLSESIIREVLQRLNLAGFNFSLPESPKGKEENTQEPEEDWIMVASEQGKSPNFGAQDVQNFPRVPEITPLDSPFRKLGNTEAQAISEKEVPRENEKEEGTNSGLEPLTPIQTSNPPTSQTASPPPSESSLTHLSSHSGHLSSGSLPPLSAPNGRLPTSRSRRLSGASSGPRLKTYERKPSESSPIPRYPSDVSHHHSRLNTFDKKSVVKSVVSFESKRSSALSRWASDPTHIKRFAQVVHLYNELRKIFPEMMEVKYGEHDIGKISKETQSSLTNAILHAHNQNNGVSDRPVKNLTINELSKELNKSKVWDIGSVCQLVEGVNSENLPSDDFLQSEPSFPLMKWKAMVSAKELFSELESIAGKLSAWRASNEPLTEGTFKFEVSMDVMKTRLDLIQESIVKNERKWAGYRILWDGDIVKHCRIAPLGAISQIMNKSLTEVANLERSQTLQAQKCIQILAIAVRIAYKVHQFAGGFNMECTDLFEKVRKLAQYYLRSQNPTWLKDTDLAKWR